MHVELYDRNLDSSRFTVEEQKIIDLRGLSRRYAKITLPREVSDEDFYIFVHGIASSTNSLPVRYLQYVKDTYQYISPKAQLVGRNRDIETAALICEPLNNDIVDRVEKIPISQKMPLHTIVQLDVENDSDAYKFVWTDNLRIVDREDDAGASTYIIRHCHICSIDVNGRIRGRWSVEEANPRITAAYQLYGYIFHPEERELRIWIYKVYNLTIPELLQMLVEKGSNRARDSARKILEALANTSSPDTA
jgi:hypothetical protein